MNETERVELELRAKAWVAVQSYPEWSLVKKDLEDMGKAYKEGALIHLAKKEQSSAERCSVMAMAIDEILSRKEYLEIYSKPLSKRLQMGICNACGSMVRKIKDLSR